MELFYLFRRVGGSLYRGEAGELVAAPVVHVGGESLGNFDFLPRLKFCIIVETDLDHGVRGEGIEGFWGIGCGTVADDQHFFIGHLFVESLCDIAVEYPELFAKILDAVESGAFFTFAGDETVGLGELHHVSACFELFLCLKVDQFPDFGIGNTKMVSGRGALAASENEIFGVALAVFFGRNGTVIAVSAIETDPRIAEIVVCHVVDQLMVAAGSKYQQGFDAHGQTGVNGDT